MRSVVNSSEPLAPTVFVRGGGTPTAASQKLFEDRYQESEARRNQLDADKRVASVPIEQGGGQLLTNQLTANPEVPRAFVPLVYVNRRREPIMHGTDPVVCKADIIVGMLPDRPTELTVILVCPRCIQQGVKHEQDCQMHLTQRNKRFEFVPCLGPPTFTHNGETFRSAGMILGSERFRCPDCSWAAVIERNQVICD